MSTSAACLATRAVWRWEDENPGDELEGAVRSKEAVEDERLVELVCRIVGTVPATSGGSVRAEYVVVDHHELEAGLFACPREGHHVLGVRADFGLGEDHPVVHGR